MGCISDYLERNDFEAESQLVAQLIVYIKKELNVLPEEWIVRCSENYYGSASGQGGDQRLVPYLCSLLKTLNKNKFERIVYNAHNKMSRKLADWHEQHIESDKEREEQEQAELRVKQIKLKILNNLTPQEIEDLYRAGVLRKTT